ncbi:unnamed protein product [Oncorhynchus mykiss]|uniref:CD82 antigen n=1 Tax=Oncorhynchus mykiss TaxID=8022 RepID=A0A060XHE9_ONCMY|nr:unnamed protein product [Oncorhynchus mykiss]
MGKGCITATKYFLFLFNLLFFIFGALIMGFGLWVLLDNQSFIAVLQESSTTLKVVSYIFISVGSLSMAMGFLGCIGAIYEIRCLLGLYFTCLLLILIAQVTAGVLIYFQRDRVSYTFLPMSFPVLSTPHSLHLHLPLPHSSTTSLFIPLPPPFILPLCLPCPPPFPNRCPSPTPSPESCSPPFTFPLLASQLGHILHFHSPLHSCTFPDSWEGLLRIPPLTPDCDGMYS